MAMAPISATGAMRFALSLALTAHVLSAYFVSKRPHTADYVIIVFSGELAGVGALTLDAGKRALGVYDYPFSFEGSVGLAVLHGGRDHAVDLDYLLVGSFGIDQYHCTIRIGAAKIRRLAQTLLGLVQRFLIPLVTPKDHSGVQVRGPAPRIACFSTDSASDPNRKSPSPDCIGSHVRSRSVFPRL